MAYQSSHYLTQDFPYFNYEPEALLPQQENLDDYFASNLSQQTHYNFMPKAHLYRNAGRNPIEATRFNTDATLSSGSTSPSLRTASYQNYGLQREQLLQGPRETSFPLFLNTNPKVTYSRWDQESVAGQLNQCIKLNFNSKQAELTDDEEDDLQVPLFKGKIKTPVGDTCWNEEMDEELLKLGMQLKCNWKQIAKKFNEKRITSGSVKMRYKELTDGKPAAKRIKFNHREDLMIAKYFERFGSNWSKMSVFFPDRTPVMLKNRYYSFIKKREIMDLLLDKVKDIESQCTTVDKLDSAEAERYTECMDLRKDNFERLLEGSPTDFFNCGEGQGDEKYLEQEKEIQILKARVKSLQSLFLQTRAELEKYKAQK